MENKGCNEITHQEEKSEKGASMVEYALLLVLIAIVAILAITMVGQDVSATFSEIQSAL